MLTKRKLLFLTIILLNGIGSLYAQFKPDTDVIRFDIISTDTRNMIREQGTFVASAKAVFQVEDYLSGGVKSHSKQVSPKSPLLLGVKLNPELGLDLASSEIQSVTKKYSSYVITDNSDAILIALGITPENVRDYRYHVVENDSIEIVPWSPIPRLDKNYGAKRPYGFIGRFNAPGKQLMVEVVNKKKYFIRDGVIFDWRSDFKPKIWQIKMKGTAEDDYYNVNFSGMNRKYATSFDKTTGLPLNLKFPADSIQRIEFYFKDHQTIPYVIYRIRQAAGKTDTSRLDWWVLDDTYTLFGNQFKAPGKYDIIIQRAGKLQAYPEDQKLRLSFEVLAPPLFQKKVSLKQVLPYGASVLLTGGLLFGLYYRNNQNKLVKSAMLKQTVSLRLKSIRSQLNPHFMYNALSSIQNLINKNDIASANHYLSKFSSLTRKVLYSGEQDMISLEDEIEILEEYLQMEQLRFGFQYNIMVDKVLNLANIEIPAMLLQPIIENAVKHGVSLLKEQGLIEIEFKGESSNLVCVVSDNGKGFDTSAQKKDNSFGLKLSKERVELLNQIYKDQPAKLDICSKASGTSVSIQLTNWL
jgi:two-component system, LytTR family, sensor kinase